MNPRRSKANLALDKVVEAASAAASTIRKSRVTSVQSKSLDDPVSNVDLAAERFLVEAALRAFGSVEVFAEEEHHLAKLDAPKLIVIDALDGTLNLVSGIPVFATTICYMEYGEAIASVVVNGADMSVYVGEIGQGAWHNGVKLELPKIPARLFGASTGFLDRAVQNGKYHELRSIGKLRNLGSQALQLCLVASGGFALNASYEAKIWDDVAGALIARETGCLYEVQPEVYPAQFANQRSAAYHPDAIEKYQPLVKLILQAEND